MANINKIRISGTSYDIQDSNAPKVVELTQAQYDALVDKDPNVFYIITDASQVDLSQYWTSAQTNTAISQATSGKTNQSDFTGHTADTSIHVTTAQTAAWDAKSNFSGDYNDLTNKLSAGTNVTIVDNVISAEGGGGNANVVELTQAQYDALTTVDPDTIYVITDAQGGDLANYMTSAQTTSAITQATSGKANSSDVYLKTETSGATEISTALSGKQDELVSGTNIKTINNESILGSGNINIQGGGGGVNVVQTTGTSTTDVMSQNAATSNFIYEINLNYKLNGRDTLALQSKGKNLFIPYMTINGEKVLSTNDLSVIETSAITTSISSSSTDAQVPSAKAVYDIVGDIETLLSQI